MSNNTGDETESLNSYGSSASNTTAASGNSTASRKIGNIRSRWVEYQTNKNGSKIFNSQRLRNVLKQNAQGIQNARNAIKYIKDKRYKLKELRNADLYLIALQSQHDNAILIDHDQAKADQLLMTFRLFRKQLNLDFGKFGKWKEGGVDQFIEAFAPNLLLLDKQTNASRNARSRPSSGSGRRSTRRRRSAGTRRRNMSTRRNRK